MGKSTRRAPDALEQQNPLGLQRGDLRKRRFGNRVYTLSIIAPTKKIANERATFHRNRGAFVRIVKLTPGYGLYTS